MLSQLAVKGSVKVTQKYMCFDLIAARSPPEKIDQKPKVVFSMWKALKNSIPAPPAPPAPPSLMLDLLQQTSGIQSYLGWEPPISQV